MADADGPDGTVHYSARSNEEVPSLLVLIIDTNPRAWYALKDTISFDQAVSNLILFINAHLAMSHANQVAVLASHTTKAAWLYPSPSTSSLQAGGDGDVHMADAPQQSHPTNKYPDFKHVEAEVVDSLHKLVQSQTEKDLEKVTTRLAGAISLALAYTNRASQSLKSMSTAALDEAAAATAASSSKDPSTGLHGLRARILVLSVSDSDPSSYQPTMNASFAASHLQIPIDTLSLFGNDIFMQQAASITGGTFLQPPNPRGIIQYLMHGLMPDEEARKMLVLPRHHTVDFRPACICHRDVVEMGFVCSVCLGVFCKAPENEECLLCGTKLVLGNYGGKPAVAPRKKRKKKKALNGGGREDTGSAAGTPRPG